MQQPDLLTGNVKKIYSRYLAAAIGSSLVTSIYSSVDMIACGQYEGPNGSAALAVMNSMWTVMICLGILVGVGGSVMLSTARGAGNRRESEGYFTVALTAGAVLSLLLTVGFALFRGPFLAMSGADAEILPYAMRYSKWMTVAVPFFLMGILLADFIRNDNAPEVATVSVVAGGVCNMIGDYFFVFTCDMGIEGAGLATMLGQVVGFLVLLGYFFTKRCTLRLRRPTRWFGQLRQVLSAGSAPFLIDLSFGVTVVLFNNQIRRYAGNDELAVFGAVANLAILFQALFYGVGRALQPLASTNAGAGQTQRVRQVLRCGLFTAAVMGLLFWGAATAFPTQILRAYMDASPRVLSIGPGILRTYALSFLLMGANVVSSYYFQAVLRQKASLLLSLLRGFLFCTAFICLLPPLLGFDSIWWSMPLTELLTFLAALWLLRQEKNRL